MIRGTTPDYLLTLSGDWTTYRIYVTFKQNTGQSITYTNSDLLIGYAEGTTTIAVTLTQEDTLSLIPGTADVQVRLIDSNGKAYATEIRAVAVYKVLLEEVISYAGSNSPA